MKNLVILFCLVFAVSANALILNNFSNSMDSTGAVTYKDKVFIKVYSEAGAAAGAVVFPSTVADDGITVLTSPYSSNSASPLCMVVDTIAAKGMGKCQVYGYTDALLFEPTTTAVAGEPIYHSTVVETYSAAIASGSVGAYNVRIGTFLDASDATGSVEAFLNFL